MTVSVPGLAPVEVATTPAIPDKRIVVTEVLFKEENQVPEESRAGRAAATTPHVLSSGIHLVSGDSASLA